MSLEIELPPGTALPSGAHANEPPRDAALALNRFFGRAPTPVAANELRRDTAPWESGRCEAIARCGSAAGGRDFGAHLSDDGGVVRRVEDGRAGDEGVGARRGDAADVVGLDAAVHLEPDGLAA